MARGGRYTLDAGRPAKSTMPNDPANGWKQKYFAGLERLERQERLFADLEELMRHGIARLCLVAQGTDPEIDRRLENLRMAVRGKQDHAAIRTLIDGIAELAREIDGRVSPAGVPLQDALLALLDRTPLPDSLLPRVARLRTEILKAGEAAAAQHVESLAGLIADAMRDAPAAVRERSRPSTSRAPAAAEEPPLPATNGVLLELLNCIALPSELLPRLEAIKARLGQPVTAQEWPELLQAIATLIADMRTRIEAEKSELENFLRQLTDRLQDLDTHLHGAERHRQASFESGRELDRTVKNEVQHMESTIRQATSLGDLKGAVQDRLDAIRRHMDEHRRDEERRQTELEEKLKHVTSRLRAVEQESNQLRSHLQKRKIQAMSDPLTGIPNRMAFEDRLAREYGRWKRYRHPLTLMILDVDHFKQINDGYGHKAGDKALQLIALVLRQHLRETDFLARYGGEEFVALLPETPTAHIPAVAEKLRRAIECSEFHHRNQRVPITLSGGYAGFHASETPDDVFQRADNALYRAKAEGRNRCFDGDTEMSPVSPAAQPRPA